jgi:hypothetical protein
MAGINLNGDSQDAVVSALQKNPQMQCWPKQQIPRKYNYGSHRRIPDIICLANLGYTIVSSSSFMIPGQHGFDPAHQEMHGIFIAAGPRVKKIQLDYFENIEIYPLLCRLLKISPEKNDAKDILFEQIIKR